jgi:enoyl-CoA hydratase/carnithine racemase
MNLTTDKMLARKDGAIGWMTFNNPARHNALSYEMRLAVLQILEDFDKDEAIRVIVMHGAGEKSFVSGADISQFDAMRATPEQQAEYERVSQAMQARLTTLSKPLIAMIRGYCMGGGLQTALSADLRIASDDSQFGIPAGRLGIAYAWTSVAKLVETVGPATAKHILFTAKRFPAAEALRMGLVTQVVPAGELEAATRELANTIAGNAPLSLIAAKRAIDELAKDPGQRDEAGAKAAAQRAMQSEDFKEGRKAFMEKRAPVWKGR